MELRMPDGDNWRDPLAFDEVVKKYGAWTAASIFLGNGQYTFMPPFVDYRLRRFVQIVSDLVPKPFKHLRVLDLACCEGQYAVEFALQGAEVVAIEIRDPHLAKTRFVKDHLRLDNLTLFQDDVRNLSREKYGVFDVVLCSGILYHIDAAHVFGFIKNIAEVCGRMAIFDTFISLNARELVEFEGKSYYGFNFIEHEKKATHEDKLQSLWSSIDNDASFWLTQPSLSRILERVGFSSLYECFLPAPDENALADRKTYVAIKSQAVKLLSSPITDRADPFEIREDQASRFSEYQTPPSFLFKFVKEKFPQPLKNIIKAILRSLKLMKPDATPKPLKEYLKTISKENLK